jgi:protein-disulfide isomerase
MLKSSKALTVGLTAIAFLGISVFFLLKAPESRADTTTPPSSATDAVSHPPVAPAAPATPAASATPDLLAAPAASKIDVAAAMKDRVLGSESAPVTIIEYASLTCPHCAHFEKEILPEVKKRLIDTGKAKLIYRDFPLDQFALKAAMMARCIPADKYYNMIELLFDNQDRWTKAKDPMEGLAQLGSLAGMSDADFKSCTENHDLETAILTHMQEAQNKYKAQSTPTFIFNDGAEQFTGARDANEFEATVNKLTKGK